MEAAHAKARRALFNNRELMDNPRSKVMIISFFD
jgi:hypothetical protein